MTSTPRTRLHGALPLIALALAVAGCGNPEPAVEATRPVTVVKVQANGARAEISYTGDVRARYETALGFRVAGKLVTREVEVGSRVRKGQVLARLDPSDYQLNIQAARSQLAAAESDSRQSKDDLERYTELYQKKFISAAEFDRRKTAFETAKARLEQARAQLGVTQNQSAYTTLRADQDGIVTAINAEVGQVVAAGAPVMKVARPEEKEVVVSVPESRLDELRDVSEIAVSLWAEPQARFKGRIREVSPSADPVTRTYTVKVTLLDASPKVQLGMTANVVLGRAAGAPAVTLPLSALYQKGAQPAVWLVEPGTNKVVLTPVKVGRYTQDAVEVIEGLKTGDTVVRAGVHKLFEGEIVRVIPEAGKAG
jgi:multidrug efflux system membrane fusion protein